MESKENRIKAMRWKEKQQWDAEEAARMVAGGAASVRMAGGHEKGARRIVSSSQQDCNLQFKQLFKFVRCFRTVKAF